MKPEQSRAARGVLSWSLQDLADKSGLSSQAVQRFEAGTSDPHPDTILKMEKAFDLAGIELLAGGARLKQNIRVIYEGDDCYLRLLDDVFLTLRKEKGEFLKFGADETRSTPEVIEKLNILRKFGITTRSLIEDGNTHIMGPLEEYRWLDKEVYFDGDVELIYGNKVARLMSWLGTKQVDIIEDRNLAEKQRAIFEHFWKISKTPTHTTAETVFKDIE